MKQTKKLTEKLRGMYEEYKAGLIPTSRLAKHLSAPLLLQPPDDWSHAEHRVLVVGQETLGWGVDAGEIGNEKYGPINTLSEFIAEDCSVDALLAQYSKFAFGDKYKYSVAPGPVLESQKIHPTILCFYKLIHPYNPFCENPF